MNRSEGNAPRQSESFYKAFWAPKIERAAVDLSGEVPPCDRTPAEIKSLRAENRGVLFVPHGLTIEHLGKMFPEMGNVVALDSVDHPMQGGWYDVEMDVVAPNQNITETIVKERFLAQQREGQSLTLFIAASQVSKEYSGHYFDEKTWSRLPGSQKDNYTIGAGFSAAGHLRTVLLAPSTQLPSIGARSQGKKQ